MKGDSKEFSKRAIGVQQVVKGYHIISKEPGLQEATVRQMIHSTVTLQRVDFQQITWQIILWEGTRKQKTLPFG